MEPFASALAAMVYVGTNSSPIAKSPKPVTPRACVVVAVRAPKFVAAHAPVQRRTRKLAGVAPPSTSPGANVNVPSKPVKLGVPVGVSVHQRFTDFAGSRSDVARF